jgi:hypothetical protein
MKSRAFFFAILLTKEVVVIKVLNAVEVDVSWIYFR